MHMKRLATYGTLAPGQINHHQLEGLDGKWYTGTVKGRLFTEGWGAEHGCPGIELDASGQDVGVFIFESDDLPDHWQRLDAFEGAEYRRIKAIVQTPDGEVECSIYELAR